LNSNFLKELNDKKYFYEGKINELSGKLEEAQNKHNILTSELKVSNQCTHELKRLLKDSEESFIK